MKRFILKVLAVSIGWDHLVGDFIQVWNIDDSYVVPNWNKHSRLLFGPQIRSFYLCDNTAL